MLHIFSKKQGFLANPLNCTDLPAEGKKEEFKYNMGGMQKGKPGFHSLLQPIWTMLCRVSIWEAPHWNYVLS